MSEFEEIPSGGRPIRAWTRGVPIEEAALAQLWRADARTDAAAEVMRLLGVHAPATVGAAVVGVTVGPVTCPWFAL